VYLLGNPILQPLDESQRLRAHQRVGNLALAQFSPREPDIFHHVAREQKHVLLHVTDLAPERGEFPFANVHAVHQNSPAGDVI
jgi:hypothetical protein